MAFSLKIDLKVTATSLNPYFMTLNSFFLLKSTEKLAKFIHRYRKLQSRDGY